MFFLTITATSINIINKIKKEFLYSTLYFFGGITIEGTKGLEDKWCAKRTYI